MKKYFRPIAILSAVILILFGAFACAQPVNNNTSAKTNIIIIGWDGAGRDNIKELLAADRLPNLKALINEGIIVAIDAERDTATLPGWSAILTGYYPEVTGVYTTDIYQSIPDGLTIFERLEAIDPTIYTAFIAGKGEHLSADEGYPYYNARPDIDFYQNGERDNEVVADQAFEIIDEHYSEQMFLFIHFREPDSLGHTYGENSTQYANGIMSDDYWTGQIIQRLKDLGIYENTLIYVTSDHGFNEGEYGHFDAPYEFLATNDDGVMRRGFRVDICPTLYDALSIDISQFSPPLDGHSLRESYEPPIW